MHKGSEQLDKKVIIERNLSMLHKLYSILYFEFSPSIGDGAEQCVYRKYECSRGGWECETLLFCERRESARSERLSSSELVLHGATATRADRQHLLPSCRELLGRQPIAPRDRHSVPHWRLLLHHRNRSVQLEYTVGSAHSASASYAFTFHLSFRKYYFTLWD